MESNRNNGKEGNGGAAPKASHKVHAPKKNRWRKAFLAAYRLTGVITLAAQKAGVTSFAVYKSMQRDPRWAEAVRAAGNESTDILEGEAIRRATQGKQPSDILLMFILKSRDPKRFRDNHRVEHTGPEGKPITPIAATGAVILLPKDGFEEAARKYADDRTTGTDAETGAAAEDQDARHSPE